MDQTEVLHTKEHRVFRFKNGTEITILFQLHRHVDFFIYQWNKKFGTNTESLYNYNIDT